MIFSVGSITYAHKARRALARVNIRSKLVKTDAARNPFGCQYGIEIPDERQFDASMELRKSGIAYASYPTY